MFLIFMLTVHLIFSNLFYLGEAETVKSSAETQRSKCPEAPPSFVQTPSQIWNEDTVPR